MRKLQKVGMMFGTDPEIFIQKKGKILGSEKVIPVEGVEFEGGSVVRDGIQVELHPKEQNCRANLGNNIANIIKKLGVFLIKNDKDIKLNFNQLVKVTEKEIKTLSKESLSFGCMKSYNYYGDNPITVDPKKYKMRSGGGHIHIGGDCSEFIDLLQDSKRMVPVFDIIVGNTCVLIDRDEGNIERRKNYGRAGEFRLPNYGIEYRTLSNFWMRSYPLMSLVFGLARIAVDIVYSELDKDLLKLVDLKDVEKAINNNDFALAYSNFTKIKDFITEIVPIEPVDEANYPLDSTNIEKFEKFIKAVNDKGIESVFPLDPFEHWINYTEGHGTGWEDFISKF